MAGPVSAFPTQLKYPFSGIGALFRQKLQDWAFVVYVQASYMSIESMVDFVKMGEENPPKDFGGLTKSRRKKTKIKIFKRKLKMYVCMVLVIDFHLDCTLVFLGKESPLFIHCMSPHSSPQTIFPWHLPTSEGHRQLPVCIFWCFNYSYVERITWRSLLLSSMQDDSFPILKVFFLLF